MAESCEHTAFESQVLVRPYTAPHHTPEPGRAVQVVAVRVRCQQCQLPVLFQLNPVPALSGIFQTASMSGDGQEAWLIGTVITATPQATTSWTPAATPPPAPEGAPA